MDQNRKNKKFIWLSIIFGLLLVLLPSVSRAYQVENLNNVKQEGDFTLGPTKIEVWADPGEEIDKKITITNRAGYPLYFKIGKEDFIGHEDPAKVTKFLGEQTSNFSLKDWLFPDRENFVLEHGQRAHFNIRIKVPESAEPGGYYAAVFVASQPEPGSQAEVKVISRVGSLFFVRVRGEVKESGYLEDFSIPKSYYQKGPIEFSLLSQNTGNVHLVPYGIIEIKNLLGRKVDQTELEPWFVMPESSRIRKVAWDKGHLFGVYQATAKINRGYGNMVDQKSVRFVVAPWKTLLIGLIGLLILILFIRWITSKFKITRKTND